MALMLVALLAAVVLAAVIVENSRSSSRFAPQTDLDRPLVVGIVSWPGYAGGIVANRGFAENAESIYAKKYGLLVRFVLIEDIDARGKAFAKGGPDGVDVVWSTVDFWANELPNYKAGGIDGRAFLQVDWSRGGDAIVAGESVARIEDLKGKKIALVQFTPSHWLLESALRRSDLTQEEQQGIRDTLIFTQDVPTARSIFVAGHADAAVLWEPDVKQALKLNGSHVLLSTIEYPDQIADIMVANEDFIREHPKAIEAFVRGWLDGVEEAKRDPDLAAAVLADNEPLFSDLGTNRTKESIAWVHWADLQDNVRMFGLDGKEPMFDHLFNNATDVWQSLGVVLAPVEAAQARDDTILKRVYDAEPSN
jgi:NitT/TauT family transport system substrate-binding protein